MQFEIQIETDYSTVRFTANIVTLKLLNIEKLKETLARIGGKFQDDYSWTFPTFITSKVLSEVIHNTCFVCGGLMVDSIAFQNTLVSSDDFGNDSNTRGSTQSRIGEAKQIKVRKCQSCGHSHT